MTYADTIANVRVIFAEIGDIMNIPELKRPKQNVKVNGATVKFCDVSFGYDENMVFENLNLIAKEGELTAIVGPSGSGKSTIAKLIAGFWDISEGKVSIGNSNIKNISQKELADTIAYVSQDNYLFDDTIYENIRMGSPKATNKEVEKAAQSAGCDEFIRNLENGYETRVGGGGAHLSGGERQRIAISRAMLKDSPIVILDEATAYTDPENERVIQKSVSKLVKGKTLIVIAHRLSTITNADQIIVMENGSINSKGTHEELLNKSSLYKEMWQAHIGAKDGEN